MTQVTIRIPTPLRPLADGASEVKAEGTTVAEVLDQLDKALLERILTPEGEIRHFVNIYLGSHNISSLDKLETAVAEGDVLAIIPAVAGGER